MAGLYREICQFKACLFGLVVKEVVEKERGEPLCGCQGSLGCSARRQCTGFLSPDQHNDDYVMSVSPVKNMKSSKRALFA